MSATAFAASLPAVHVPPPLVRPMDLAISLCLPQALRDARLRVEARAAHLDDGSSATGPSQSLKVGGALAMSLEAVVRAAFREVDTPVACNAPDAEGPPARASLTVRLVHADVSTPSIWRASDSGAMLPRADIALALTLTSADGKSSVSWESEGGAIGTRPVFSGAERAMESLAALAVRDVSARVLADLHRDASVRAWLAAQGLTMGLLQ
jgi:hypothetical protein